MAFKLGVTGLEVGDDADNERKRWVWETVQKKSIKILITKSDRFDAAVREKGVKMAVISSPGELRIWGQLRKIREWGRMWLREGSKGDDGEGNVCRFQSTWVAASEGL